MIKELNIPPHIICIGAAKTKSSQQIQQAISKGLTHIGENYIQEAEAKEGAYKGAQLHFIGHLQSNKAKTAVHFCHSIDSVHSIKLANKINKEAFNINKIQNIMIEINIANEPQKHGISVSDLSVLISHIKSNCLNLKLTGLMMIPPKDKNPRKYFKELKKLCEIYKLDHCSMGMSSDYQIAIEEGATHIRLGTAIFGARKKADT